MRKVKEDKKRFLERRKKKLARLKKNWKDFKKKKNIIRQEMREIIKGIRENFSTSFPKKRKYLDKENGRPKIK